MLKDRQSQPKGANPCKKNRHTMAVAVGTSLIFAIDSPFNPNSRLIVLKLAITAMINEVVDRRFNM